MRGDERGVFRLLLDVVDVRLVLEVGVHAVAAARNDEHVGLGRGLERVVRREDLAVVADDRLHRLGDQEHLDVVGTGMCVDVVRADTSETK